jgi:hypothetical protein
MHQVVEATFGSTAFVAGLRSSRSEGLSPADPASVHDASCLANANEGCMDAWLIPIDSPEGGPNL